MEVFSFYFCLYAFEVKIYTIISIKLLNKNYILLTEQSPSKKFV